MKRFGKQQIHFTNKTDVVSFLFDRPLPSNFRLKLLHIVK